MSSALDGPFARDLIGYGRSPPHPQWPGGACIAVNFVMNYEEGSEYSCLDGDGRSEASLKEALQSTVSVGLRRFLDYIKQHDKVWVARRSEIAEHWHRTFPWQPGMEQIAKVGP